MTNDLASKIVVLGGPIRVGDTMRYRIANTGSIELICGVGYGLDRKTSEGWTAMNPGMAFPAIGLAALPNKNRELRATIPAQAPPGVYRISTTVNSGHAAKTLWLSTEFDVVE